MKLNYYCLGLLILSGNLLLGCANINREEKYSAPKIETTEKKSAAPSEDKELNKKLIKQIKKSECDYETISNLIDSGADINSQDELGRTPLMYSVLSGHEIIIELLLSLEVDTDLTDNNGNTALMMAANKEGSEDIAKLLIEAGADINILNKTGKNAMQIAKVKGNNEILKILSNGSLLAVGFSNKLTKKVKVSDDRPDLIKFSERGNFEKVLELIENNLFEDESEVQILQEALNISLNEGQSKIGELLLAKLEEIQKKEIMQKEKRRKIDLSGESRNPLIKQIITQNRIIEFRHLLLPPNIDLGLGNTPLHLASSLGRAEIVKILISQGLRHINQPNLHGDTPLNLAVINGHEEIIKILIGAGADINNKTNISGDTPLILAAKKGHEKIISLLCQRGADTNIVNKSGKKVSDYITAHNLSLKEKLALILIILPVDLTSIIHDYALIKTND